MQEVLELVCRKRKIDNPGDYSLILKKILVPLDRTVTSLQGEMDLEMVKKSILSELGVDTDTRTVRTVDPNGSFEDGTCGGVECVLMVLWQRRYSRGRPNSRMDLALLITRLHTRYVVFYDTLIDSVLMLNSFQKYNVVRKMPMLGRHERVIAIDSQYVHLLPSASKARAVFEIARTMSYHIRSVAAVQQTAKASATFKLIVQRNEGAKRYEFEAENPRLAGESNVIILTDERQLTITCSRDRGHHQEPQSGSRAERHCQRIISSQSSGRVTPVHHSICTNDAVYYHYYLKPCPPF
jgi:hypothetical protein